MRCHDIHGNHCPSELAPDWKFCPTCGRKPAAVVIASPSLLFPFCQPLPLRHRGFEPANFLCRLDHGATPQAGALRIKDSPHSIRSNQLAGLCFEWAGVAPPPSQAPLQMPLRILTDDGEPRDPFSDDPIKTRAREWLMLP